MILNYNLIENGLIKYILLFISGVLIGWATQ